MTYKWSDTESLVDELRDVLKDLSAFQEVFFLRHRWLSFWIYHPEIEGLRLHRQLTSDSYKSARYPSVVQRLEYRITIDALLMKEDESFNRMCKRIKIDPNYFPPFTMRGSITHFNYNEIFNLSDNTLKLEYATAIALELEKDKSSPPRLQEMQEKIIIDNPPVTVYCPENPVRDLLLLNKLIADNARAASSRLSAIEAYALALVPNEKED